MTEITKMNTYAEMWNYIHKQLFEMACDKYNKDLNELNLFIAIILRAARDHINDRDVGKYFKSEEFESHCRLLRLNKSYILSLVQSAATVERERREWSKPTFTEEEEI